MVRSIVRNLLLASETSITILGTLFLSLSMNLVTSFHMVRLEKPNYQDLFLVSLACIAIFWGVIIFSFIERCRILERFLEKEKDATKRETIKEEFIKTQMSFQSTKRIMAKIKFCLFLSIIVVLLFAGKFASCI